MAKARQLVGAGRRRGIVRLPATLGAALDALEADATVKGFMPPLFLKAYLANKRAELALSESWTAEEICNVVTRAFPHADVKWDTDLKRQRIVDSWPAEVDDTAARRDWGFAPRYDFARAFDDYLIPTIRERYRA